MMHGAAPAARRRCYAGGVLQSTAAMPPLTRAAVLVPLFRTPAGARRVALIRRVDAGPHAGEIALPGGKQEPGDASLQATAVRETVEEIGVAAGDIEVLASLPVVETFTTGFAIHPFLARVRPPAAWSPQAEEVAEVVELAVEDLLRPGARTRERIEYAGRTQALDVDCYRLGDLRIWGATFRILEPVLARLAHDPGAP
ncbi:MAG: CoA pyrophosphatase [Halofilum sp. (in: g-proteobacteria)]|nr:CoA pyrophosphatase [Halofilum sp. (in: g-proteobacteria)]